jgi:hypothetical protein
LTHAPAVFSDGTVNADFSLRVDGRLERGASLIATDLLCTSGGHIPANAPHFSATPRTEPRACSDVAPREA